MKFCPELGQQVFVHFLESLLFPLLLLVGVLTVDLKDYTHLLL